MTTINNSCTWLHFPSRSIAKPKLHATDADRKEIYSSGEGILDMDVTLICTAAFQTKEDETRALRRAAGLEKMPKRDPKTPLSELDKNDERHPQNGGEVVICDGCKERERKRYDRKKKKSPEDERFIKYENDRVIMINEKEYKKFQPIARTERHYSPNALSIDFALRIACYCRHQEDKSPQGFRIIFTFRDSSTHEVLGQNISNVIHITDDHKNKDLVICPNRPVTLP
ncbi:hypothetical protein P280DRAFT_400248, partial [Massarina eburnea CBS 473.64]